MKQQELSHSEVSEGIAYDPETGQELWRVDCLKGDVAPSVAFAGGLVYVCNMGANLTAIRPDTPAGQNPVVWSVLDNLQLK